MSRTENKKKLNILLFTNRNSDNTGDQVMEACDISLIHALMKNLGYSKSDYKIDSRDAGMIGDAYLIRGDLSQIQKTEKLIQTKDMIIFGGAPMFNYLYQRFYERTAVIIEMAQKYNIPVLFSALGIEGYDEENAKCQRLKKTLNFDCVKQITTRDDFESLKKYKENPDLFIDRVADPAVFSFKILEPFAAKKKTNAKKKVGVFVLRSNGFKANKIDFSREEAAELWADVVEQLKEEGLDYELLTSGHFADEAFLDHLIREYHISPKKCVFNVNTPEQLIQKISSYDAVISCRLHPSIISYSFGVPSVGIVWNSKVTNFYAGIGYENRLIDVNEINGKIVVDRLKQAMEEGVVREEKYLMSVYTTLFETMKKTLCPKQKISCYTYEELLEHLSPYPGTSEKERQAKLRRKFRRSYHNYNQLVEKSRKADQKIREQTNRIKELEKNTSRTKKFVSRVIHYIKRKVKAGIR